MGISQLKNNGTHTSIKTDANSWKSGPAIQGNATEEFIFVGPELWLRAIINQLIYNQVYACPLAINHFQMVQTGCCQFGCDGLTDTDC